ncbi:MAG: glycoside hydrolase family 20 zincin-like fold domain-containing protein [Flavobacteriales bacterium]
MQEPLVQQPGPADCERALVIDMELIAPDTLLPDEWYSLTVEAERIRLAAPSEEGLYRGSRSLLKLLEHGSDTGSSLL